MRLSQTRRIRPRMDITAMVDCVFLLLIFFLLTSTYVERRSLQVDLAPIASGTTVDQQPARIEIAVTADGRFLEGETTLDEDALRLRLEKLAELQPAPPLSILSDTAAPAGRVLFVLDTARGAGLTEVDLAGRETRP